jgi:aspartokinase
MVARGLIHRGFPLWCPPPMYTAGRRSGNSWQQRLGDAVRFDTHLSALSLIGEGLNRTNATLIEALALVENHGIIVAGATTTSFRISLLISRDKIDAGVRLCHGHWISKMGSTG